MSSLSLGETAALVAKLKLAGYKVQAFGRDGWACEVDGLQVFRATALGNERFDVKRDERIFADV